MQMRQGGRVQSELETRDNAALKRRDGTRVQSTFWKKVIAGRVSKEQHNANNRPQVPPKSGGYGTPDKW